MLPIGKKPKLNFEVDALVDGRPTRVVFSDLLAGPTVVSVWMRNNTSACDKQSAALSGEEKAIVKAGYRLIGLSRDACASHVKYAVKHRLGYTLVADPDDLFSKAMDAIVEKSMYGKTYRGPARAAYVLGADGKLLAVVAKVDAPGHGKQVLEALAGLG